MLTHFRYLLTPIAIVYGAIISVRNWLFDKKILKSASFNFPIICVGNLATGGTGKTPMTEYLIEMLQGEFQTATLSRGYKRKTKGFAIADSRTTAIDIGDEPMQFHRKFPDVTVAVGEERLFAIPQILHLKPGTDVIVLDDAFQHRAVSAGFNILLTAQDELYTHDFILPVGNLRDHRSSSKRAQAIIVTKCKPGLTVEDKQAIAKQIAPLPNQQLFFTEFVYSQPYHLFTKAGGHVQKNTSILLVCGIANPASLKQFLHAHVSKFEMIEFADHHIFTIDDLKDLKKQFDDIVAEDKMILTTEKDAVRLEKFKSELSDYPIYVLPVKHSFLFGEGPVFRDVITGFINSFKRGEGRGTEIA